MRAVCAWCGVDLGTNEPADAGLPTHGICEECYLDLRVKETLNRLHEAAGPYTLYIPPDRPDLALRIKREAPPGCTFVVYEDRRSSERRNRRLPVPADRRRGRDRRFANLSFLGATRTES